MPDTAGDPVVLIFILVAIVVVLLVAGLLFQRQRRSGQVLAVTYRDERMASPRSEPGGAPQHEPVAGQASEPPGEHTGELR